ncbi:TPA: hypothetical protein N0F65_011634 [Lagenidium giganteum]|uniref:Bacterial surface antigen (D15) domain-containing protein n=1 Tax=Lagenidium giganteum TaxID=4803 RepID=A0AAV2ZFS4_9STRA|nr:TPA: hypothetical protein N0F65_011634 [Lagenidium giganteum]
MAQAQPQGTPAAAGNEPPHPWGPPMRIRKVILKGNKRTKPEVFENELQDAYAADRIGYIATELEAAAGELKSLGIFDSIDITLDKAEGGARDELDVTIAVQEKGWRKLHVGATTDGKEDSAETSCTLLNAFGHAETVTFAATYSLTGSNAERAVYQKPRFLGLPFYLNATVANELHNHQKFSSYNEKIRGGSIAISDYQGMHELSLNFGWRDIIPRRDPKVPTAYRASPSILAEALPSTKTSLKYVYKDDSRNNLVAPTSGGLFEYSTEVAGAFGDVNFVKTEVTGQKHFGLGPVLFGSPLLNFSVATHLGAIKCYGVDQHRPARISDRFFLGGPMSLRGFNHKGIGPRASPADGGVVTGDALGGDLSYRFSAAMGFPLPIPLFSMRGQVFANAGNVTVWSRLMDEKKWMKNLVDDTRVAVGMGIVWGSPVGRIEANYSWILKSLTQDNIKQAQIGLGLTFT